MQRRTDPTRGLVSRSDGRKAKRRTSEDVTAVRESSVGRHIWGELSRPPPRWRTEPTLQYEGGCHPGS